MHSVAPRQRLWWLRNSIVAIMMIACIACSSTSGNQPLARSSVSSNQTIHSSMQLLPGEEIWKQGVSSYLFGTTDTHEWSTANFETQPAIQKALHQAGFTLVRSFFQDNASDADIEQRIEAIEHSGAHCLGVIFDIFNVTYDEHLVQYLGKRCLLYEFGDEPDFYGTSINAYLVQWNTLIPLLRHINPEAKFIGPADGPADSTFLNGFLHGVKSSGVLPDAISFHWYPCYQITEADCLSQANTAGQEATAVRRLVKSVLGEDLPVGITEWNYDPGNPPSAYGGDKNFITAFSQTALQSMIQAGVRFACQFDVASYAGYGRLDMFDIQNNEPKPQFYAIASMITQYRQP